MELRTHPYRLKDKALVLRPLTEDDWDVLMRWNQDPEILYYSEGDDVQSYSLEEVQHIFRTVSQQAHCFLVMWHDTPIGDAWLQELNLERLRRLFDPRLDLRRIDLTIGEKRLWRRGLATRAIRLLTRFGFENQEADVLFGCDVADYNLGSRRALEKSGFHLLQKTPAPGGAKARILHDYVLTRPEYDGWPRSGDFLPPA